MCARAYVLCECVGACVGLRVMPQERQAANDSRAVCARPRGTTHCQTMESETESARETEGESARPGPRERARERAREGAGGGDEREERERETRCAGRQRSTRGEARRDLEAVDVLEPTRVFSETLCVTQFVTHIRVTTGGTLWVRPMRHSGHVTTCVSLCVTSKASFCQA